MTGATKSRRTSTEQPKSGTSRKAAPKPRVRKKVERKPAQQVRTKTGTLAAARKINLVRAASRKTDAAPASKIGTIVALLRKPKGASIADMMSATGWQAHSVRGAISASVRKKLGLSVVSEKSGAVRLFRIEA